MADSSPLFKKNITLQDALWATSTMISRSFTFYIPHKTRAIIPYVDMFNHNFRMPKNWDYNKVTGRFQVTTNKRYKAGDQVISLLSF
jgi:hypothetical protein